MSKTVSNSEYADHATTEINELMKKLIECGQLISDNVDES